MIIKQDFNYSPKGKNRTLHIYLPDDYESSGASYPVMYFFDGHNLFFNEDATYGKSWGLKEFLDGWNRKLIVIGIECGHEGEERMAEYMPYPSSLAFFKNLGPVMGRETMDWIVGEIKPWADRTFRTLPGRETTGIGGASMGGLMSLYAACRYNRYFSKAACVSSSIGFCQAKVYKGLDQADMDPATRVYLSWGTCEAPGVKDIHSQDRSSGTYRRNRAVANKLEGKGVSVLLHCQVEGRHCEADWEKQLPLFMNWLWEE